MQTIVYPFCPDFLFSPIFCVLPEDYYVWWGFEDEKLIEYAKEDLTELASSDQPFNYTMLTVDTHFEDGYVCDLCQDLHDGNQYGNVISCSDKQVSEFVSWIQQQDWYDNTTIVITGDHPTMDSDFCDPVSSDYSRRVYTAYINADPVENHSEGERQHTVFSSSSPYKNEYDTEVFLSIHLSCTYTLEA